MALNIPLPNPPAGSFQEGFKNANALSRQLLENQMGQIKNQYAPVTIPAEAASKLAYANLMGPQFLAKMMGNPDIAAQLKEQQRQNAVQTAYNAGTLSPGNMPFLANSPVQQNPFSRLLQGIGNLFGGSQQQPQQPVQQQQMASNNSIQQSPILSQEDRNNINNMQPGDSYVVQGNTIPKTDYFEKSGYEQGKTEKGKQLGKARGEAITDIGKEYKAGKRLNDSFQELTDLMNLPAFQKMRTNIPFFQDKQMAILSKIGTPEEQEMIGNFKAGAQKILANAVNSFEGRKFLGEFQSAKDVKINENDTYNTIVGKLQAAMILNNYDMQRSDIAADLMDKNNLNEKDAFKQADKRLDRKEIENKVKNLIKITIINKKTGEQKTIPINEARKLGVPNV